MNALSLLSCWMILCVLASAAGAGTLSIDQISRLGSAIDGPVQLRLSLDLSGAPADALEHGITLPLLIQWRQCEHGLCSKALPGIHIQARYAPLQDRYLLEHQDQPVRAFAFRPSLLDALENPPPVAVPAGSGWQLRVRLRVRHLPPPLRLPARLQSQWRVDSGWVSLP